MCREQFAIKPLKRHTPWQYSFSVQSKEKTAIILGAGLAGCFTANALAKRGWSITLIEELDEVGSWGSANEQAILFPKLSAYKSPFTEFMLSAFLYASQCYRSILKQFACGEMNGSLVLAHNEKEIKAQDSLKNWLSHYPELGVLVDAHTASQLSGLPLTRSGLFIPHSGWMNSPDLCKFLINSPEISLVLHQHINSLVHDGVNWKINDKTSPILILATGNKVNSFVETEYLPIQSMRGQISRIKSTNLSSELKIPVCAEGHVLPQKNGTHLFGATYELESKPLLNPEDDLANFAKLSRTVPENIWSKPIISHWAGIRASTPDYLPLVGPVAKLEEFITQFKSLEEDSKRWIGNSGPYYPGLYTCAGFGSRGLTTIPLCSEWLASVINREVGCLPRHLIQAIAPARFLRKDIIFKRSLKAKKD
jgi:tRNA 5-methylaminomethyl-2-thiouridine biosynthesis bifunctional protein